MSALQNDLVDALTNDQLLRTFVHRPGGTFLHMSLKGSGGPRNAKGYALPSPHTEGGYAKFLANEVANRHEGICFVHGSSPSLAEDPVVQGNRIRDCGRPLRWPTGTPCSARRPG
jgi:hypothetical protein